MGMSILRTIYLLNCSPTIVYFFKLRAILVKSILNRFYYALRLEKSFETIEISTDLMSIIAVCRSGSLLLLESHRGPKRAVWQDSGISKLSG